MWCLLQMVHTVEPSSAALRSLLSAGSVPLLTPCSDAAMQVHMPVQVTFIVPCTLFPTVSASICINALSEQPCGSRCQT